MRRFGRKKASTDKGETGGALGADDRGHKNIGKDYTQTFEIPNVEAVVAQYPQISFETEIGDVVFLSFFLLHESGKNVSPVKSRITCQVRYFDMNDETAIRHDWKGGWQEGGDFTKLHPDKVVP